MHSSSLALIEVQSCHFQRCCSLAPLLYIFRNPSWCRDVREEGGACWWGKKKSLTPIFRCKQSLPKCQSCNRGIFSHLLLIKCFSPAKPFVCKISKSQRHLSFPSWALGSRGSLPFTLGPRRAFLSGVGYMMNSATDASRGQRKKPGGGE